MKKKSGLLTHICRERKVCAFSGWWWWEGSGRWWWTPVASTCVDVCAPLRCTPLKWVAAVLIAPDWLSPIRINYKIASSAAERQRNQLIDCDQLQLRWDEKERERVRKREYVGVQKNWWMREKLETSIGANWAIEPIWTEEEEGWRDWMIASCHADNCTQYWISRPIEQQRPKLRGS